MANLIWISLYFLGSWFPDGSSNNNLEFADSDLETVVELPPNKRAITLKGNGRSDSVLAVPSQMRAWAITHPDMATTYWKQLCYLYFCFYFIIERHINSYLEQMLGSQISLKHERQYILQLSKSKNDPIRNGSQLPRSFLGAVSHPLSFDEICFWWKLLIAMKWKFLIGWWNL